MEYENVSYVATGWAYIASIGWYLFGLTLALWYASPYIKERYTKWKLKRDEEEYAAKYHKNTDLLQERLEGLEAARRRMQEKYEAEAALAREREQERREKKLQEQRELLEEQSPSGGKRLGTADEASTSNGSKPSTWKPEYNPLMGDNSRGYRAPKRSCCGKGGCG